MAVYRRSARPRFTLLLLVLASVTVITLDFRGDASGVFDAVKGGARDLVAPVQDAVGSAVRPVGDVFNGVIQYGDLEAENARLREQLADTDALRLTAEDAAREREALLDQLELDFVGDIPTVPARVVSLSPSNFDHTITIDRGRDQGVADGMPVVAGEGLVGRVVSASKSRATVRLLVDTGSSVGVRLGSQGEVGIATGIGGSNSLEVELIDSGAKIRRNQAAVTSGLEQSLFPPAIPVGRVASVKVRPGSLSQDVRLRPVVDFRRLTFVQVLLWSAT